MTTATMKPTAFSVQLLIRAKDMSDELLPILAANNMKTVKLNEIMALGTWIKGEAMSSFQELSQDFDWLSKQAVAHDLGIRLVAEYLTVLPFKLGAFFSSEEELTRALMPHHGGFLEKIEALEGKKEFGLKVYYHPTQNIGPGLWPESILSLEEEVKSASAGKAFLLNKKLMKLKSEALFDRLTAITEKLAKDMESQCVKIQLGSTNVKHLSGTKGELLLNIAVLIEEEKEKEWLQWVEMKKEQVQQWGLEVIVTGPWPPYCFS